MSDGYRFVPLPDAIHRCRRNAAVFDQKVNGALSGWMDLAFISEQQIHIGSGFKALQDGKIVRTGVRIVGRPGFPGSSVKGMLRSRYEAITKSCITAPKNGRVRSSSHRDILRAELSLELRGRSLFRERCAKERMCPTCALFGRMSQRSRIAVSDFATDTSIVFEQSEIPEQFSPNLHHLGSFRIVQASPRHGGREQSAENIFEVLTLHGRKFGLGQGRWAENAKMQHVEVIPKDCILRGQIRLRHVLHDELGGLLVALGMLPTSKLKIGAGKCYGFGRMRLHDAKLQLRGTAGAPVAEETMQHWYEAFSANSADRFTVGEETLIRIHQGDC